MQGKDLYWFLKDGQDPATQQVGRKSLYRSQKHALFIAKAFGVEYANYSWPDVAQGRGKNSTLIAYLIYSNSIKENDLILISSCFNYFYPLWFTCELLSEYSIGQYKLTELLFFMNNCFIACTVTL